MSNQEFLIGVVVFFAMTYFIAHGITVDKIQELDKTIEKEKADLKPLRREVVKLTIDTDKLHAQNAMLRGELLYAEDTIEKLLTDNKRLQRFQGKL